MKTMMRRVAALVACAMLMCLCVSCAQEKQPENPPKYTIYLGLNDADTGEQVIPLEQAQQAARDIITGKGSGYTEHVAHGGYASDEGVVNNETLVYEICFAERALVEEIAREITEQLHVVSPLLVEGTTAYGFVE